MAEQQYALTPQSPVRRFPVIALVDLVGFVLLGLGLALGRSLLIVIGAVLVVAGAVLITIGLVMYGRITTRVLLGEDGIRITSGGRTATAAWSDIEDVATDRHTIYLNRRGAQPPLKIDSPRGGGDARLADLSRELVVRLDRSRGYRDL